MATFLAAAAARYFAAASGCLRRTAKPLMFVSIWYRNAFRSAGMTSVVRHVASVRPSRSHRELKSQPTASRCPPVSELGGELAEHESASVTGRRATYNT